MRSFHVVAIGGRPLCVQAAGRSCSVHAGTGLTEAPSGSVRGTHPVLTDLVAARRALVERGVGGDSARG